MIGLSVIGTPNGLEISSIGINKDGSLVRKIDLDNAAINIFPQTDALMVLKEIEKDYFRYYFVYYRYATEINNTRSGSYYGSIVTLQNRVARPSYILKVLLDLADIVKNECLNGESKFKENITNLTFHTPDSAKILEDNAKKETLPDGKYNKEGFFSVGDNYEITDYRNFIDKVLNDPALSDFQKLYASEHNKVLNYVKDRKVLKILSLSEIKQTREQELVTQHQLEQEKIKEQEQTEEAKRQKEAQEKEVEALKKNTKLPTAEDLPTLVMNLTSQLEDVKRQIKFLTDQQKEKTPGIGIFAKLPEKIKGINNRLFYILLCFLVPMILLVFWFFFFYLKVPEVSGGNNINSKPITPQTSPSAKSTEVVFSSKISTVPSDDLGKRRQFNYQKNLPDVKTVRDLIKLIKSRCSSFCSLEDSVIAEDILKINPSIKIRKPDIDKDSVLDFELENISGTTTFEVSPCCDLSAIDPVSFKPNTR